MAKIKIPRHQGPDGQGLPRSVFEKLLELVQQPGMTAEDMVQAVEFCFGASTQQEWNETYAPELKRIFENT